MSVPSCAAAAAAAAASASSQLPLLAGAVFHLARGFGAPKEPSKDLEDPAQKRRAMKKLRGKIIPCVPCKGSGKKPCQFCDGTTMMVGFLGKRVPCVPCQGKATLGRPCPECQGMGYLTP